MNDLTEVTACESIALGLMGYYKQRAAELGAEIAALQRPTQCPNCRRWLQISISTVELLEEADDE